MDVFRNDMLVVSILHVKKKEQKYITKTLMRPSCLLTSKSELD